MQKLAVCALLLSVILSAPLIAQERVMVGDDIFVSADEELGDTVCIGCSIYVEGRVRDAVAVGGSVTIAEGAFARDVVAVMGSVVMNGEAQGDSVAIMGSSEIGGPVGGDAVSVMGGSEVSGDVDGSVVAVMGGVTLAEGVTVGEDLVAVMGGIERAGEVVVHGEEVHTGDFPVEGLRGIAISGVVAVILLVLFFALAIWPVVSIVTFLILGRPRVSVVSATVNERAGMCFLIGFGTWFASIILSVMLPLMFFWAPGAAESLVSLALFVSAAVGYTGVSFWVGGSMVKGGTGLGATFLGSVLITIIQAIPVIGWFIAFPIFGWLSLGAAVVSGYGTSTDWLFPRAARDVIAKPAA